MKLHSHSHEAELFLDAGAILAEGPCWNADQGKLYWVDIQGEKFCRVDPSSGMNEVFSVGKKVGAVVCAGEDQVMLATRDGFESYDCKTKQLSPIIDPEQHLRGIGSMTANAIHRADSGPVRWKISRLKSGDPSMYWRRITAADAYMRV